MEPDHPIVIMRLAFIFLCALPAVRELYQYVNDPRYVRCPLCFFLALSARVGFTFPNPSLHSALTRPYASLSPSLLQNFSLFTNAPPSRAVRMGQHVWLLLATVLTELLVIVKWSTGQYPAPFPKPVKVGLWTLGLGVVVVYPMYQVGCLSVCVCVGDVEGGGAARARRGVLCGVGVWYRSHGCLLTPFVRLFRGAAARISRARSFCSAARSPPALFRASAFLPDPFLSLVRNETLTHTHTQFGIPAARKYVRRQKRRLRREKAE
jgi:hypothetical protein